MATVGGRLILLLASRDTQTAQQLAKASTLNLAEVTRQLAHLMTDGFVVLASAPGTQPVVYRLSPKGTPAPQLEPH
jgi:predicted ArsR family transcriptional regulator